MSNSVEFYTISFRNKKNNKEIEYVSVDLRAFFDLLEQTLSVKSTEKLRVIDYRAILAPKVYRNKDFIVIPFGKLKDGKVYTSNKDNFEEIDSDVFEITSIAYDINFNIAMKTINKLGPSVTLIEGYINSFLPEDCPYVISFIPILQNYGLEKLRNAKIVKSITLEFDFGNGINKYFYENTEDNGGIGKSLNKMFNNCRDDLDTQKIRVKMSVGRKKEDTMNVESVRNLLASMDLDNDSLSQVIIEYKNGETEKKKPAYLRNTNILLKDTFPLKENYINPMYLLNNCEDIFLKNRYVCNVTVNEIQKSKMSADYELKRLIHKLPNENYD